MHSLAMAGRHVKCHRQALKALFRRTQNAGSGSRGRRTYKRSYIRKKEGAGARRRDANSVAVNRTNLFIGQRDE